MGLSTIVVFTDLLAEADWATETWLGSVSGQILTRAQLCSSNQAPRGPRLSLSSRSKSQLH